MLDRNLLRNDPEAARAGASAKHVDAPIDEAVRLIRERADLLTGLEAKQAELNKISKSIGALMGQGKRDEAEAAKAQTKGLKEAIQEGEARQRDVESALEAAELSIPNIPHASVPEGKGPEDNVVVRQWGEQAEPAGGAKPHWEIAERLGLLDLARASKISGSGFALYTGWGARLQRALFNFMADHQTLRNGYREIYPPFMVTGACLIGTGQLPKFEEDLYKVDDDLYLIPTAEVPVTNLYRDEILDGSSLPIKMAAYSGCFRREAGAAGKDTRGIQRVHQFDKVELVKLTLPEDSLEELESLTRDAESVLQALGLHYRVSLMCTAEMGFSNSKQYDLELWSPGLGRYLEVSSCSNFDSFQARRANIRFRRAPGEKPEFVHTLNGSGVACPRLFACLIEACLQADGSVLLPEVLRPYVGTDRLVAG
ncbi:MAG: serine--tRNA ligase [Fimbriimonas ginsengisoli]|uniref:Serine--tRNA ligase n=1 Tax=Fimbriimonas ginsengisoli TaxID=1005039 RepID=A0A931LUH8_FIMGI|nr:serine--tRNA ligase [Fimbriimonas ginsengisoli]